MPRGSGSPLHQSHALGGYVAFLCLSFRISKMKITAPTSWGKRELNEFTCEDLRAILHIEVVLC